MRRRFGSTVHFSPSRDIKEFFLVVSFSSASFPLTADSVSIALQCCIGGISSGFKVVQINSRSFRFSVANNKVGHFICGLKDHIWPDFVCHFHLYNGRFTRAPISDSCCHADEELLDISTRRPIAIKSHLGSSQVNPTLKTTSALELSKFQLAPIDHMVFSNKNFAEASISCPTNQSSKVQEQTLDHPGLNSKAINANYTNSISLMEQFLRQEKFEENQPAEYLLLGSFKCIIKAQYPSPPQCFLTSAFKYAPPCGLASFTWDSPQGRPGPSPLFC